MPMTTPVAGSATSMSRPERGAGVRSVTAVADEVASVIEGS
jgi:hypothetical protein